MCLVVSAKSPTTKLAAANDFKTCFIFFYQFVLLFFKKKILPFFKKVVSLNDKTNIFERRCLYLESSSIYRA